MIYYIYIIQYNTRIISRALMNYVVCKTTYGHMDFSAFARFDSNKSQEEG